jgi:hypothetical protein
LKITRFAIKLGFTFAKVIDRMTVIHAALDFNFEIFIVRDQLHIRAFVAHLLLENLELAHAHTLLSHFHAKKRDEIKEEKSENTGSCNLAGRELRGKNASFLSCR